MFCWKILAEIQENEVNIIIKKARHKANAICAAACTQRRCSQQSFVILLRRNMVQWFAVMEGVEAMFTDAGHIIGSAGACAYNRKWKYKQVTFSGDVGTLQGCDSEIAGNFSAGRLYYYGINLWQQFARRYSTSVDTLLAWIEKTCIEKRGKLIMPAFSLGRTQEILYALNQLEIENRLAKSGLFFR